MSIPVFQQKHILRSLAYGMVLLAWLSTENHTLIIVTFLGVGLAFMVLALAVLRWLGGRTLTPAQWLPALILWGAGVGFLAVWSTVGLMIFKNAWHSHAYPDFATSLVVGMTHRVVPWTVAGGLVGGAIALLRLEPASEERNGHS